MNHTPGPPIKIAMLVDNGVEGDSRVQKEAESAAAAGYDVLLLGIKRPASPATTWQLGQATVRLVDLEPGWTSYSRTRALLRAPLSYANPGFGRARLQHNTQKVTDLRFRVVEARAAATSWSRITTIVFRARILGHQQTRRWITRRLASTEQVAQLRKTSSGRVDRFWTKVHLRRRRPWKHLLPNALNWETAFGPAIDEFAPDLIHANDSQMIPVGARAKVRALAQGRDVKLVWDAHEYLPGITYRSKNERWLPGHVALEREFVPYADVVTTVTEPLADLLIAEHQLTERPTIVMNAPIVGAEPDPDVTDIRTALGLADDVQILAYCGGLGAQRGLETVVRGLPLLPDNVVLALVVPGFNSAHGSFLLKLATELGVRHRVKGHAYVAPDQITRFLSTATVGLTPHKHMINHEIALPTKYFEFSHARLPIITSDIKAMAQAVRQHQQGEVFTSEDHVDFARAAQLVLADPDRYRSAYDDADLMRTWTWEHQAQTLMELYESTLNRKQP